MKRSSYIEYNCCPVDKLTTVGYIIIFVFQTVQGNSKLCRNRSRN